MHQEERRQRRSDDPLIALHYQLAQARSQGALDAIVVADTAGVVVAGAGPWAACEELAAYAPILASARFGADVGEDGHDEGSRVEVLRGKTAVSRVEVDGGLGEVLFCAHGGRAGARAGAGLERTLAEAMRGVARILRAAA
jgi:hypothetical protein